jgi:exonuclease SbcD
VRCALLPFVSQRYVVRSEQLMAGYQGDHVKLYEGRIAAMVEALTKDAPADAVNVIVAHATIVGGRLGGGERTTQTGFEYEVPAAVFPVDAHYVALGHLHRHQVLGGARPVVYAGSPLQLDFGESDDRKGVVVVEAAPASPASFRFVELESGRRLRTIRGRLRELEDLAGTTGDDLLRVVVADKARVGLADDVRALFPLTLEVQLDRSDEPVPVAGGRHPEAVRTPQQLFADYLAGQQIDDERLVGLFGELLHDEV